MVIRCIKLTGAFEDKKLFCWSFTPFIFGKASLELSDAGNSPEFHNTLDKPVSSFDGSVITCDLF